MARQQELQSVISLYGRVDSSVGALAQALKGIGKSAEQIGGAISMLSVPIIAAGKESISLYTNYDDVMKAIQAVGGYTASEMETISTAARKAGAETRFMATDAGNAFLYLTQAGVDMEGSLAVLPSLLNAAAAGQMDLATTSDLLISNIYSLGKSFDATDVSTYVDAVTTAADATNTNLAEIMEGVSKVGAAGRMFGGGTNELLTFMGMLSNLNLKGTTGGVNARNMIISLLAPTDKAGKMMEALAISEEEAADALADINLEDSAKAMEKLGLVTVDAATGKVYPMIDILTDLKGALSGLSDDEVADTLYTIFGKRTYPAVAGLLEILDLYPEIMEQVENSMGSAEAKAAIMESGIGGTTRRLKSAWEELGLAAGGMASPTVIGWMETGRDVILDIADAINSLDPETAANITEFLGGIAVAGPGLVIAGKAISGVGTALNALTTPTGKVLAIAGAFGVLAWAVDSAQDAAARASLESHFGNIEVDAEKMQGIIDTLASDFETKATGLNAYAEAISTASTNYQTAVSALSGGLLEAYFTQTELNETDKKSLMNYATSMQTSLKEALSAQKLRVSDIIDMSFDGTQDGDTQKNAGWDALASSLFGSLETEAQAVGEKMRAQMVEALKDDKLSEDELEAIRASQARMNEIMAQISKIQGDFNAKAAYNRAMLMSYDDIDAQLAAVDEAEKVAKQSITDAYASLFALIDLAEEQGTVIPKELQKAYGIGERDYAGARFLLRGDYETELTGANAQRNMFAARIASEAFNAYGEELNSYYEVIDQLSAGKITLDQALEQGRRLRRDKKQPREKEDVLAIEQILADMGEHLPYEDLKTLMDYQLGQQGFVDPSIANLYRDYLAANLFTGGMNTSYGAKVDPETAPLFSSDLGGELGTTGDIQKYLEAPTEPVTVPAQIEVKTDPQQISAQIGEATGTSEPVQVPIEVKPETEEDLSEVIAEQTGEITEIAAPVTITPDAQESAGEYAANAQEVFDGADVNCNVRLPDGYSEGEYFAEEVQEALDDNPGEMDISVPSGYAAGSAYASEFQAALDAANVKIRVKSSGSSGGGSSGGGSSGGGFVSKVGSFISKLFADGGRTDTPAVFGEAGPEWAIPEQHTQRTAELLASAARASGFTMSEIAARTGGLSGNASSGGSSHFVYSPTIYANDTRGVQRALDQDKEELEAMFEAFMRQKERVSYA